jgi:hypothetical protein
MTSAYAHSPARTRGPLNFEMESRCLHKLATNCSVHLTSLDFYIGSVSSNLTFMSSASSWLQVVSVPYPPPWEL